MKPLNLLSLFAGIGGFELGLERSGAFKTVAQCEIDPFCRRVLAKHWPYVPRYEDVRTLTAARLAADGVSIDAICGGFPCQDISIANGVWGDRAGLAGSRSGLFSEIARLAGELRPRFIILENVEQLLANGLLGCLGALASLGYDAEWHAIPASRVGSIQNRDRVWIVAYHSQDGGEGLFQGFDFGAAGQGWACRQADLPDVFANPLGADRWPQPLICRGDGRPAHWVDRIGAVGNAVVPQVAELIGRAIGRALASADEVAA